MFEARIKRRPAAPGRPLFAILLVPLSRLSIAGAVDLQIGSTLAANASLVSVEADATCMATSPGERLANRQSMVGVRAFFNRALRGPEYCSADTHSVPYCNTSGV